MKRLSSFFLLFVVVIVPLILPPSSSAYYTNMPASVVVGKPDFTSSDTSITSSNISIAGSGNNVFTDGKYLFVSDSHRVLLWNSIPTANGVSADVVLGQPDFISNTANNGGISARTFSGATGIAFDGTHLVVADLVNNRVLIWNSLPTVNQQPADVVIGQSGFSTATSGTSATAMTQPNGVYIVNGKLYIGAQHRVLIYNSIPTTNGAAANVVVGQPDFSSNTANNGGISASTLNNSRGIYVFNNKLFVSDSGNNRVLIWNSIPTTNGVAADIVLGQPDFVSNTAGVSCASMTLPSFIRVINNQRLVVGETNRVLIWNSIPTTNFTSADLVLGQPDCSASTSNNGGLSARSLNGGIRVGGEAGNKLIIGDTNNRRLLIFNNDLPDTKLTNTLVSGIENGRQRFKGTASTNVVNGVVRYVEYSINGSSWTGAFPADGQFNDATEDYSFDFDPKSNNPDVGKNVGFVVRVRNTHNNTVDSGSSAVYFEPFVANAPQGKPSYTTGSLPSFSFSINSWRFEDLVKDLDSFRIAINKDNQGWVPYIENIPVSYEKVRESGDNKRRSIVPSNGNGVYENKTKIVTYTSNNGTIEVQAKAVNRQTGESSDKDWDNGGFLLPKGSYLWRVEAVDRSGHTQATGERTLFVGGSRQIITSRSWFPLTIDSFTGVGNSLDWSSVHPQDIPATITSSSQTPTITGIAVAGSFVTATIDGTSSVSTTTEENSRYTLTLSPLLSGNDYSLTLSVSDTGGNYNALPEVQLLSEE